MTKRILFSMLSSLWIILSTTVAQADLPASLPNGCTPTAVRCSQPGGVRRIYGKLVYRSCWQYTSSVSCPDWVTTTSNCANLTGCTLINSQQNSDTSETNTYQCQKTIEKNICTQTYNKLQCVVGDKAQGNENVINGPTGTFPKVYAFMSLLNKLGSSVDGNVSYPLSIFPGENQSCRKPIHLAGLTEDCCEEDLSSNESWYKLNQCSDGELSLASARRANRDHYIGEYCDESMPIIGCTREKRVYCVFPSELDRIVQEQGRAQINAMAASSTANDEQNALVSTITFPYTQSAGVWHTETVNGVKTASWSWPTLNSDAVPVYVQSKQDLVVPNNGSAAMNGLSVTMSCKEGSCAGNAVANGTTKSYSFTPDCGKNQSPKTVYVHDSLLQQQQ